MSMWFHVHMKQIKKVRLYKISFFHLFSRSIKYIKLRLHLPQCFRFLCTHSMRDYQETTAFCISSSNLYIQICCSLEQLLHRQNVLPPDPTEDNHRGYLLSSAPNNSSLSAYHWKARNLNHKSTLRSFCDRETWSDPRFLSVWFYMKSLEKRANT